MALGRGAGRAGENRRNSFIRQNINNWNIGRRTKFEGGSCQDWVNRLDVVERRNGHRSGNTRLNNDRDVKHFLAPHYLTGCSCVCGGADVKAGGSPGVVPGGEPATEALPDSRCEGHREGCVHDTCCHNSDVWASPSASGRVASRRGSSLCERLGGQIASPRPGAPASLRLRPRHGSPLVDGVWCERRDVSPLIYFVTHDASSPRGSIDNDNGVTVNRVDYMTPTSPDSPTGPPSPCRRPRYLFIDFGEGECVDRAAVAAGVRAADGGHPRGRAAQDQCPVLEDDRASAAAGAPGNSRSGDPRPSADRIVISGIGPLHLRGGGVSQQRHGETTPSCARRRPPGAGVSEWLEDEEAVEERERAELEARAMEAAILAGQPAAPDGGASTSSVRPFRIYGEKGGVRTIMCADCYGDFRESHVTECSCGRVYCGPCRTRVICRCGARHRDHDDRHPEPVTVSLFHALGLASQDPVLEGRPSLHELSALGIPCQREEQNGGQAAEDVPAHGGTSPALRCGLCSVTSWSSPTGWVICRCGATLCVACGPSHREACESGHGGYLGGMLEAAEAIDGDDGRDVDDTHGDHVDGASSLDDASGMGAVPAHDRSPCVLSPGQAFQRRERILDEAERRLRDRRAAGRMLERRQRRNGQRPPRQCGRKGEVLIVSANVGGAGPLRNELQAGSLFNDADFVTVQEHKLCGDSKAAAESHLIDSGWDCLIDEAYFKHRDYGGGAGILASRWSGVRPASWRSPSLEAARDDLQGRCAAGIVDMFGGLLLLSFYGVSGLPPVKQLRLWRAVATLVSTIGLPFIIGADWQCTPREVASSGLLKLVEGIVASPGVPTNIQSSREIDFFIISASLGGLVQSVEVSAATAFTPHVPVVLRLRCPRSLGLSARVVQPRLFGSSRPEAGDQGQRPRYEVDWDSWLCNGDDDDADVNDAAVSEWFAGAALELSGVFNIQDTQDEAHYAGIGKEVRVVQSAAGSRRRGAPDDTGLIGHRLSWVARYLHVVIMWWRPRGDVALAASDSHPRGAAQRLIMSAASRAAAFLREDVVRRPSPEDVADAGVLEAALAALAGVRDLVNSEGNLPHLYGWPRWVADDMVAAYAELYRYLEREVADASSRLASRRRRRVNRATAAWARQAPLKLAHAVTKPSDRSTAYSASASKSHAGEATAQLAADRGIVEWSPFWKASQEDKGDEALRMLDALASGGPSDFFIPEDGQLSEIQLPPIDEGRLWRSSRSFRGDTGVALDWARPRHVSWLSIGARAALARLFNRIERAGRWPSMLRNVLAVALSKKGGGARLIGLLTSLYRIWARTRYHDIRESLEARLSRQFLSAAPGEGAQRAAGCASLLAEGAHARGEHSATTLADISKFYEQVEFQEMIEGALAFGVPRPILALAVHQYSGPRRIRVDRAYSQPVYPGRSIVPGCTWATVLIRTLVIGPCEKLLQAIRRRAEGWDVRGSLNVYVDDLALTTSGCLRTVSMLHVWSSRVLMGWVTRRMHKQLAIDKLACVASSSALRAALRRPLRELGCSVVAEADLLGADFGAGGVLRTRKLLRKRIQKAARRRGRMRWWRRLGGCAREVARGGIMPSISYGASAAGLPPRAQLMRRRMQAAALRIGASGSSLTSKLAVGGPDFGDCDPSVIDPSPQLGLLLQLLWDRPRLRADFLDCWRHLAEATVGLSAAQVWRQTRGMVSAAWAHLRQIGAEWTSPFRLRLLEAEVDLLTTSPLHVMQVVREHARLALDRDLVLRIMVDHRSDEDGVATTMRTYSYGIDWDAVRRSLRNRDRSLLPVECRALELVVTQALWPEERRWRAGLLGHGTCLACLRETGDQLHRIRKCDGVRQHLGWQRLRGRIGRSLARDDDLDGLPLPLLLFGLPPREAIWTPRIGGRIEGGLRHERPGVFFGDGSGYGQDTVRLRQATWALTTGSSASGGTPELHMLDFIRGAVQGWHPTVPRGEIAAIIRFLDVAAIGSTYVGDCKYALDVVRAGIPPRFRSSSCGDADLWRTAARALGQRGGAGGYHFIKIKSHQPRAAAEADGGEAVALWEGNHRADLLAKSLARCIYVEASRGCVPASLEVPGGIDAFLGETAMGAAWAIQNWPDVGRRARARRRDAGTGSGASSLRVGPHTLAPHADGGWFCIECLLVTRTSASRKSLRSSPCQGTVPSQCHSSHELRWSHGVYWCWRCGRYTVKRPRALRAQCPGVPASAAGRNVLRRLREGRPPTTAAYLQRVAAAAHEERRVDAHNFPPQAQAGDRGRHGGREGRGPPVDQGPHRGGGQDSGPQPPSIAREGCDREPTPNEPASERRAGSPRVSLASRNDGGSLGHSRQRGDQPAGRRSARCPATRAESGGAEQSSSCGAVAPTANGRPLHDADDDHDDDAARPAARSPVRRAEGNLGIGAGRASVQSGPSHLCRPTDGMAWSTRIVVSRLSVAVPCAICQSPTRGSCRGCSRQLCMQCARCREWCPQSPSEPTAGGAAFAVASCSVFRCSRVLAVAPASADGDAGQRDEGTTR